MAYEQPLFEISLPADVDMTDLDVWQFAPVWLAAASNITGQGRGGACIVAKGSLTAPPLGVLQHNPRQGEAGHVMVQGISKLRLGGTVAVGDVLGTDSNGLVIKAASGSEGFAKAFESGAKGDIIAAMLIPMPA